MSKIILLEKRYTLSSDDEKSNVYLPFNVPEEVKKLCITYSYSPKILEDEKKSIELIKENIFRDAGESQSEYTDYSKFMPLKNLVTLSLLASDGAYWGAAHRQADKQYHEISEDFASPGFIRGRIASGQWTLCLNVHAFVTDMCICDIMVEAEVGL